MELCRDRESLRRQVERVRRENRRVAFVPTMGALHAGHLSLFERARPGCDLVAASIFVNPLQFGPQEDLGRYPRDLEGDLRKLDAAGCDLVFAPAAADMYAPEARTVVEVTGLGEVLCGRSRPGHFRGVTTVVAKLLHLVRPQVAVFGQKDAQQAILIRRMVRDLDMPVELRFAPIVRDPDGLAMSSRNAYLDPEGRRQALLLQAALQQARAALERGERRADAIVQEARRVLDGGARLRIDYVELVDTEMLGRLERAEGRVLLALAAWVGSTRLIDNLLLDVRAGQVSEALLQG